MIFVSQSDICSRFGVDAIVNLIVLAVVALHRSGYAKQKTDERAHKKTRSGEHQGIAKNFPNKVFFAVRAALMAEVVHKNACYPQSKARKNQQCPTVALYRTGKNGDSFHCSYELLAVSCDFIENIFNLFCDSF
jgi:hypothetical protein